MKADHMPPLIGISIASSVIGLGLLGFAGGAYLKTGIPVLEHALFDPAINCMYTGLTTAIFMIIISPAKDKTTA